MDLLELKIFLGIAGQFRGTLWDALERAVDEPPAGIIRRYDACPFAEDTLAVPGRKAIAAICTCGRDFTGKIALLKDGSPLPRRFHAAV